MGDKLRKELLDVDLSGINIKIQAKHPKAVELIKKISEMLSNIGIPFKFSDITDAFLYTFSKLTNENVCIAFLVFYLWAFLIDDHLERNYFSR